MSDLLGQIKIGDIDISDDRYCLSISHDDIGSLAASIKEAGMIYPPVVQRLGNKFIIVSGFNRIRAQIYNNETCTLAYQLDPHTSDYDCLVKSITTLAFKRPLTHFELIKSTVRLHHFLTKEQIAKKSSAIFNTRLNTRFVADLLALGELPAPGLTLIHNGRLSFKAAKRIADYEPETLEAFLTVFSTINASHNKQLEIILHTMEISARDAIDPKTVFSHPDVQQLLLDDEKDAGLKTTRLRALLFEQRFPMLFKTRSQVQKKIDAIHLGHNIKFLPPENFESQNYSIEFTVKDYTEFMTKVLALHTALETRELKDIFQSCK